MKNTNIIKTALVLTLAASTCGFAANESDIENLEKQLIYVENELFTPELRLDDLQKERSEYDGISGWFKGSKKKALDAEIEKQEAEVSKLSGDMNKISTQIQSMVFEVAKTFEAKGNYDKAIEYYLKVTNINDTVRARIAACYKAKKDYQQAIKWLMEMTRSDANLLEVVDCYHLDKCPKQAIYWLFKILEPFQNNGAEKTALKLIEEYKYNNLLSDYPDYYVKLSDIYIQKAFANYKNNSSAANADYKKAVELRCQENNEAASTVSMKIVNAYQSKYTEALEILNRQKEAAERNYQDKLRNAENELSDAEHRLRRAVGDSERHYMDVVRNADMALKRAEDNLRRIESNPQSTPQQKDSARRQVENAIREIDRVRREKPRIIHDYLRPYEHRVKEANDDRDKLVRDRTTIIENYIAPYKKAANDAKSLSTIIKSLHSANF
ncbi:MAG: hypothetical protein J6Z11_08960 [Candidatus Riflebacteria bacterium]|nr:hypothetical protein [Candidatus Riflebacteria bacterium]